MKFQFVMALARAARVHHWVKNVLIFLPLILAHQLLEVEGLASAALGFLSFSLCASGVYLVNDVRDQEVDRKHPVKQNRPIASGEVTVRQALIATTVLVTLGIIPAILFLPWRFNQVLVLYLITTTAYSLWLKEIAIVDVMILASLYTTRIFAGAIAVNVIISPWFLAFSIFFFLNLAFLKRYTELLLIRSRAESRALGRGYRVDDLAMFLVTGPVSGYLSVLVFALYVTSDAVADQYNRPNALWFACGFLLYWITHTWFRAHRGEIHDDPVVYALRDPYSYAAVVGVALVLTAAAVI